MSQDLFKKILRKYKGKLHSQDTMELSDVGIFMLIMFDLKKKKIKQVTLIYVLT